MSRGPPFTLIDAERMSLFYVVRDSRQMMEMLTLKYVSRFPNTSCCSDFSCFDFDFVDSSDNIAISSNARFRTYAVRRSQGKETCLGKEGTDDKSAIVLPASIRTAASACERYKRRRSKLLDALGNARSLNLITTALDMYSGGIQAIKKFKDLKQLIFFLISSSQKEFVVSSIACGSAKQKATVAALAAKA